jgi:hypothetical protein
MQTPSDTEARRTLADGRSSTHTRPHTCIYRDRETSSGSISSWMKLPSPSFACHVTSSHTLSTTPTPTAFTCWSGVVVSWCVCVPVHVLSSYSFLLLLTLSGMAARRATVAAPSKETPPTWRLWLLQPPPLGVWGCQTA